MSVTPNSHSNSTPETGGDLIERLCIDMERRIASGEQVRCESILVQYPDFFSDPELALDLIYAEFTARCDTGNAPNPREYFERFPELRVQLEQQFQLSELLDQDLVDDSPATDTQLEGCTPRYRVTQLHAKGGIGQVMRALDVELNREVAIKEIQPVLVGNADVRERFLREAEITGRLEHPGIVPVYGLGQDPHGLPFYAMRLVRGQCLSDAIKEFHLKSEGRFDSTESQKLLRRFLSVCETVAFAHSRGIIHRDIKPQNVLLGPFGETLVVDWGLAKIVSSEASADETSESLGQDSQSSTKHEDPDQIDMIRTTVSTTANWEVELTQSTGTLIGTPAYMSPEQARGDSSMVGPASDIYSLGATLYSLITGRPRFGDSDVHDTIASVVSGAFPKPREINHRIPRSLEAICLKAVALMPRDRYASVSELAADIERFLADEPVSAFRESISTAMTRWGRRNRKLAVGSLIALVLVTLISTLAAFQINGERVRADRERIEVSRRSARLAFDRGYQLIEQQQFGEGMLWFVQALHHSPREDRSMRQVILTNLAAAKKHLVYRVASYAHDSSIFHLGFSGDGNQLLTKDGKGILRFWDVDHATEIQQHRLDPSSLLASRFLDGRIAMLLSRAGTKLLVQHLSSESLLPQTTTVSVPLTADVTFAEISQDGQKFALNNRAENPNKVYVYDSRDGQKKSELLGSSSAIQAAFLPNSHDIAVVNSNGLVQFWHWVETESHYVHAGEIQRAQRIDFSPDGKTIIVASRDGAVSSWSVETKSQLLEIGKNVGGVTALAISSDSKTMAAVWENGVARAWNLSDGQPASEIIRLDRHVSRLVFRPQSKQLLILVKRDNAVLWELPSASTESTVLDQSPIDGVDFSEDGMIAVTAARNGEARLRNGLTGEPFGNTMRHRAAIKHISISPDSKVVLTASLDGTARLWNTTNGSPIGSVLDHRVDPKSRLAINCGAFSRNGRLVATGDSQGIVRLWDSNTGEFLRMLEKTENASSALSLCFSPDSRSLLVGYSSSDNGVRMWDVETGTLLWKGFQRSAIRSVSISPDGRTSISAGNDETARMWNSTSGDPVGPELSSRGEVFVARFSPDNKLAVTAGYDATIRLWDVPTGRAHGEPMLHQSIVVDVAFSSDGRQLISSSTDNTTRLWDVATCLPLSAPLRHNRFAFNVRFNPVHPIAISERLWKLPKPLIDQPDRIDRWARLATQRSFTLGNNVQWLDYQTVELDSNQFISDVGMSWQDWSQL